MTRDPVRRGGSDRRAGKSCFNFTRIDDSLLQGLADLTERAARHRPTG